MLEAGIDLAEVKLSEKPKNFYPVDSAITIKDGPTFVTVMNDRAQAGTADKGVIELVQ